MRSSLLIIFVFTLVMAGCAPPAAKGPLSFQLPPDWSMEYQSPGGLHFYTVIAGTPDGGLLMFSQWPPPNKPQEIPGLVQKIADGFLDQARKSSEFSLATQEYRIEQFASIRCQGSYAVFQTNNGGTNIWQTVFMMSVDGRVWNGQFTGPSNAWIQAIGLLKSIKDDS
ncbi:MAG: hypothetical protein M9920_15645 [Verrucomicrobiae bacterium]|nr:hypothetical protein [Verrucomicrobiae bacterium]